jgi:alkanesulfonate monooxygenase SsuD/methylene tetrahydromethanopterin reductase-like flavin-dependent oxidoreductase (luciferase family)
VTTARPCARAAAATCASSAPRQIRLSGQQADPLFLASVQFLQARDDFPDVRPGRERG